MGALSSQRERQRERVGFVKKNFRLQSFCSLKGEILGTATLWVRSPLSGLLVYQHGYGHQIYVARRVGKLRFTELVARVVGRLGGDGSRPSARQ